MPADSSLPSVASSAPPAPVSVTPAAAGPPAALPDGGDETAPGVDTLGDRIAELAAGIAAATGELLGLIREFDARNGWTGFASCAEWLSWRTGLAPGAAREHVRVARALADLPLLRDALRRGAVSYSKVRAVTRVATPETEQALLDVALAGTAAHVEQIVRTWRRVDRAAEAAEDAQRHASRSLATWVDEDGMVVVRGRLTPEVGAAVRRALDAALDAERREAGSDGAAGDAADDVADGMAPTPAQRRADALGAVAECALAGGLDKGTAGDRYQVVVHVDADTLATSLNASASDTVAGDGSGTDAARDAGDRQPGLYVPAGTYKPGSAAAGTANEAARAGSAVVPAAARRHGSAAGVRDDATRPGGHPPGSAHCDAGVARRAAGRGLGGRRAVEAAGRCAARRRPGRVTVPAHRTTPRDCLDAGRTVVSWDATAPTPNQRGAHVYLSGGRIAAMSRTTMCGGAAVLLPARLIPARGQRPRCVRAVQGFTSGWYGCGGTSPKCVFCSHCVGNAPHSSRRS